MEEKYEKEIELLQELEDGESWIMLVIATAIGCVPAIAVVEFLSGMLVPVILWALPGAIVGFMVRFVARPYKLNMRLVSAATLFVLLCLLGFYGQAYPTFYLLALTNALVIVMVSKRKLDREQERAVWLAQRGKISKNS